MDDHQALIRFQAARAEGLRDAARTHRLLRGNDAPRAGLKASVAALLRGAAERLDPTPHAPRARSI